MVFFGHWTGDRDESVIGIVIVAHGGLAQEYRAAIDHVVGRQEGVSAISIAPDDDRSAKQAEICAAADAVDQGGGVRYVRWFALEPFSQGLCARGSDYCLRREPAPSNQTGEISPSSPASGGG